MAIAQKFTMGLLKHFLNERKVDCLINFSVVISLATCHRSPSILFIGFVAVISLNHMKPCIEKIDTAGAQMQKLQYLFHGTTLERHIKNKLPDELLFDTISTIVLSVVSVTGLIVIFIKVLVDLFF